MARDPFLRRFTGIFQEIATGIREEADAVPSYVHVGLAPPEFVRWMGGWTGLPVRIDFGDEETARDRIKAMVSASANLYRRRGTRSGLAGLMSAVTGGSVTVTDTGGIFREGEQIPRQRHVTVNVPNTGGLDASLLHSLIADELPVNCTFDLVVDGTVFVQDGGAL